jgi:leader peptidase (prepilin peptidase)/N-methyltransferase
VRYLLVEVLTGGLFFLAWWWFPPPSAILAIILFTILVVITFIDAEHQVIPIWWTSIGSLIAILAGLMTPDLLDLSGELFDPKGESGWAGLRAAGFGWLVGFGGLSLVVLFGKLAFGRFKLEFDEPTVWKLSEGHGDNPQLHFVVGDRAFSWDDLFYRASDRLEVTGQGIRLDGKRKSGRKLVISRDEVRIGEEAWPIEKLTSLTGHAERVVVPREAMGMGDPHLLGMIGAFLGWPALLFVILSSCLFAIAAALVARIGFGKPLPFGPFLSAGALAWIFGGWKIWNWYFGAIQGGL